MAEKLTPTAPGPRRCGKCGHSMKMTVRGLTLNSHRLLGCIYKKPYKRGQYYKDRCGCLGDTPAPLASQSSAGGSVGNDPESVESAGISAPPRANPAPNPAEDPPKDPGVGCEACGGQDNGYGTVLHTSLCPEENSTNTMAGMVWVPKERYALLYARLREVEGERDQAIEAREAEFVRFTERIAVLEGFLQHLEDTGHLSRPWREGVK